MNPPWGEDGETPSWEICPCCGTEFGYEDCTVFAAKKQRAKWMEDGAQWTAHNEKPANWKLEDQIKNIPKDFL